PCADPGLSRCARSAAARAGAAPGAAAVRPAGAGRVDHDRLGRRAHDRRDRAQVEKRRNSPKHQPVIGGPAHWGGPQTDGPAHRTAAPWAGAPPPRARDRARRRAARRRGKDPGSARGRPKTRDHSMRIVVLPPIPRPRKWRLFAWLSSGLLLAGWAAPAYADVPALHDLFLVFEDINTQVINAINAALGNSQIEHFVYVLFACMAMGL